MLRKITAFVCMAACVFSPARGYITICDQLRTADKVVTLLGDIHQHTGDCCSTKNQLAVLQHFSKAKTNALFLVAYAPSSGYTLFTRQLWQWLESSTITHMNIEIRPYKYLAALDALYWSSRLNQGLWLEDRPEEIGHALSSAALDVCHGNIEGLNAPSICQHRYDALVAKCRHIPTLARKLVAMAPHDLETPFIIQDFVTIPDQIVELNALKHVLLAKAEHVFVVASVSHIQTLAFMLQDEGFVRVGRTQATIRDMPLGAEELAQALAAPL